MHPTCADIPTNSPQHYHRPHAHTAQGDSDWLHILPAAFWAMLVWVDKRYGHPTIIITENGVDVPGVTAGAAAV